MLCHLYKPNKIKTFIIFYEIKSQIHSSRRLLLAGPPNEKGTKENLANKPNVLSIKTNEILANIDVQVVKDYYRNKLENSKSLPFIRKKFYDYYQIYEEISGMDKVRIAQEKVLFVQDKLKEAQDRRRELLFDLSAIRKDLQQIHADILNCGRGEGRYLDLVKKEIDTTREEQQKLELFQIADTEERELFSHLTSAVKMSHEQERVQANTVKYWSIIGTVLGALLGILATALSHRYRNTQIVEIKSKLADVSTNLLSLNSTIEKLSDEIFELQLLNKQQIIKQNMIKPKQGVGESWGHYLSRKFGAIYHYFIPNKV